ncbi:hypothetical protein JCM6882_003593 [Rhodosporidiobolus microsporus]
MSTDKMEQAFLDGTHPALARDAAGMEALRRSPSPSRSDDGGETNAEEEVDTGKEPLNAHTGGFSAVDPDPPTGGSPPVRAAGGGKGAYGGSSRNTGVKGVQADYREHMAAQQQQAAMQRGGIADKELARGVKKKVVISLGGGGAEDEELERLRRERLEQLKGSGERGGQEQQSRAGRDGRKTFGHLREVGMEGFVSAVEDEDEATAVLVHLYEPEIPPCHYLNQHLSSLARLYPYTKFLRAQASEVDFMSDALGTDVDTLPTVVVYRAGEVETVWVRFDLELRGGEVVEGERGRRAVEEVLASKGVIDGSPLSSSTTTTTTAAAAPFALSSTTTKNGNIRQTTRRRDGDSDDSDEE